MTQARSRLYDGDYDTWEGNIYIHDYQSGNWINVDAQMLVVEEQEWYEIWTEPIGGGPGSLDPRYQDMNHQSNSGRAIDILLASNSGIQLAGWFDGETIKRKYQDWGWCAAFGCAGAYAQCRMVAGPVPDKRAVAGCAAGTCIGIGIGCLAVLR